MKRMIGVTAATLAAFAGASGAQARAQGPSGAQAHAQTASSGGALAQINGNQIVLANNEIVHRWTIEAGGRLVTTELADPATNQNWSTAASPEFQLLLDSVQTSSSQGWTVKSVDSTRVGGAVQITFKFETPANLLEVDRTWTLYPNTAVQSVTTTLINHTPTIHRIGVYSLAELTASTNPTAIAMAFHGGSDWRQDFRVTTTEPGSFNDEGEIAQFGGTDGWFLVGERRSGAMNRVARDADGRTWVGVDNARDVLDAGPLLSNPPAYNRIENPAWPSPIRQRTLQPNGTLFLGKAYLGVYHGGTQQAPAAFLAGFEKAPYTTSVDLNTFHPWGHGPGLSDQNLRAQAKTFKALGGEVFMLDDQWQGKSSGDWNWDSARFPIDPRTGMPRFVEYLRALKLNLGLWMSPAEFNPNSTAYKTHPNWACTPTGDLTAQVPDDSGLGVWDINNPQLRDHLNQVIDRLIAQDGVKEFKFDYVTWVDCPPYDYLDYEDAYANWVHQLEAEHPNVTFELDETNDQRLWALRSIALGPSWFDNGHLESSSYPARLLHDIFDAAPWLPPSTLGFGTYDNVPMPPYSPNYLMPIALLGHVTFWSNLDKLSTRQMRQTRWWVRWYERHRQTLSQLVYEDTTTDPINGASWVAFQPWSPTQDHGYLFAFRQEGGRNRQRIELHGLRPGERYEAVNVRTGRVVGVFNRTLTVTLAHPYTAIVLQISKISCQARRTARTCRGQRRASGEAVPRPKRSEGT